MNISWLFCALYFTNVQRVQLYIIIVYNILLYIFVLLNYYLRLDAVIKKPYTIL